MTSGDGARGRNDAIPVNQAQSGFQPGTLTDANPPRPAGDVSNLASAVPCLGVELAITGDSTLPRFTTRAELDPISEIIARWDVELEEPRPAVWGDFFTCTGCRDLEECRAAFGNEWGPDGTGCADWTPKP